MYKLWVFHEKTFTFVNIMPGAAYDVLVKEMLRWNIAHIEYVESTYKDIPF